MKRSQVSLYHESFEKNNFERTGLFERLRESHQIRSALYMGSFVHITPAFVFPVTAFVDSDRRMKRFFESQEVRDLIDERRRYAEEPVVTCFQQDYRSDLPFEEESFDLLISQYGGFVSQAGKKFLKRGGVLLANNSHGDAGRAHPDDDYAFVSVAKESRGKWRLDASSLDGYFIPKKGHHPTVEQLESAMKGVGYTKTAPNYIFERR